MARGLFEPGQGSHSRQHGAVEVCISPKPRKIHIFLCQNLLCPQMSYLTREPDPVSLFGQGFPSFFPPKEVSCLPGWWTVSRRVMKRRGGGGRVLCWGGVLYGGLFILKFEVLGKLGPVCLISSSRNTNRLTWGGMRVWLHWASLHCNQSITGANVSSPRH